MKKKNLQSCQVVALPLKLEWFQHPIKTVTLNESLQLNHAGEKTDEQFYCVICGSKDTINTGNHWHPSCQDCHLR